MSTLNYNLHCYQCKQQCEFLIHDYDPTIIVLKCNCSETKELSISSFHSLIKTKSKIPHNSSSYSSKRFYIWRFFEKKITKTKLKRHLLLLPYKQNQFKFYCKKCKSYYDSISEHNELCSCFSKDRINLSKILPSNKLKEIKEDVDKAYLYINKYIRLLKDKYIEKLQRKIDELNDCYAITRKKHFKRLELVKELLQKASIENPNYTDSINLLNNSCFNLKEYKTIPSKQYEMYFLLKCQIFTDYKMKPYKITLEEELMENFVYITVIDSNVIAGSTKDNIIKFYDSSSLSPIFEIKDNYEIDNIIKIKENRIAYTSNKNINIVDITNNNPHLISTFSFQYIIKTLLLLPNDTFCTLFYKEKPYRSFARNITKPYSCFYTISKLNSVTKPFYTKEYNDILYEVDIYKTQFLDRMLINANYTIEIMNTLTFQIETVIELEHPMTNFYDISGKVFAANIHFNLYVFDFETYMIISKSHFPLLDGVVDIGDENLLVASSEEDGEISFKGEQYVYHYRTGHTMKYEVTEHDMFYANKIKDGLVLVKNGYMIQLWKYS